MELSEAIARIDGCSSLVVNAQVSTLWNDYKALGGEADRDTFVMALIAQTVTAMAMVASIKRLTSPKAA